MNGAAILTIKNLSCQRQNNLLFSNLTFRLHAGEMLLITGGNGSGKSSLLRLIAGLATAHSGEVLWCEQPLQQSEYKEHMHFIGHSNGLKLGLSVEENLQLAAKINDSVLSTDLDSVLFSLKLTKSVLAKQLSAGQKRRAALARLVLLPKKLWLVDEPFTALDTATQQWFINQLQAHLTNGGICVMSSHHALPSILSTQVLRMDACTT